MRAEAVAWALLASDFAPGDVLAVAMPWNLEHLIVALGVGLAGCTLVSLPTDADGDTLAQLLTSTAPKALVAVDGPDGTYGRLRAAGAPPAFVVGADADLRDGDLSWTAFLERDPGGPLVAAARPAEHLTHRSVGGTADWSQLEPIKAAADAHVHLDLRPGDVLAWPTPPEGIFAPWSLYAALLNGATLALFEGPGRSREFCCFVADVGVTKLGVSPSLVRGWRDDGLLAGLDWHEVRAAATSGGPTSTDDVFWLMQQFGYRFPVLEYPAVAALGGAYVAGTLVEPQAPGTASGPAVGTAFILVDRSGRQTSDGDVVIQGPILGLDPPLRPGHRVRAIGGGAYAREG